MSTKKELENVTNEFFNKYWNPANGSPPSWSKTHWFFNGSIPQQEKQGCYALFHNDEVLYIGVGVGQGDGMYSGAGLGYRLKRYWKVDRQNSEKQYTQREGWENVTSILTIGFPNDHYFLAAALEIYLIQKLSPKRNRLHIKQI